MSSPLGESCRILYTVLHGHGWALCHSAQRGCYLRGAEQLGAVTALTVRGCQRTCSLACWCWCHLFNDSIGKGGGCVVVCGGTKSKCHQRKATQEVCCLESCPEAPTGVQASAALLPQSWAAACDPNCDGQCDVGDSIPGVHIVPDQGGLCSLERCREAPTGVQASAAAPPRAQPELLASTDWKQSASEL